MRGKQSLVSAVCVAGLSVAAMAAPFVVSVGASAEELTLERLITGPSLSGASSFQGMRISPDGQRLTFLRGKEKSPAQLDLWELNTKTGEETLLVDSDTLLGGGPEIVSEEEKARRERNRALSGRSGIVTYFWSADGKQLLFPLGGDLYVLPLGGKAKKLTDTPEFEIDPRFSPNGKYVSFIRDADLYVVDVETGAETRLTEKTGEAEGNGVAEFAAQEELGRFTGYWWSPNEKHIVFANIDESGVTVKDRYELNPDGSVITKEQRYPEAGGVNAAWRLGVAHLDGSTTDWVSDFKDDWKTRDDYLARVHWLQDGDTFIYEHLNRPQTELTYRVRTSSGAPKAGMKDYVYKNDIWVNLYNDFQQLDENTVLLTRDWNQGESGDFKHILKVNLKDWTFTPITQGDWVVSSVQRVDRDKGLVYFTGFKDTPTEQHLYSVSLEGGEVAKLTTEKAWHDTTVGSDYYVDTFSSPEQPAEVKLHSLSGEGEVRTLVANTLDANHPYAPYLDGHVQSKFGTIKAADGETDLYYRLYLPKDFDKSKSYPAIMAPYGGPHGQLVRYSWTMDFNHFLARNGYVVMVLDNRGMWNRGLKFESHIKNNMGRPEIDDQVAGVNWLVENGYADKDRIGITGWSYGGFMTLMGLSRAGDVFKAGAAIAPVSDWRLYDTAYTERYLGHPEAGEGAVYNDSSVFKYLGGMQGELLLIHGMADDNVFFDNSVKLMSNLQNRSKTFELMTYPGKKHGIRGAATRLHLRRTVFDFFERKLK